MYLTQPITASAAGDTKLVSGVAGRRIRVLLFTLSFGGTVNAKFNSGPAGAPTNDLTGLLYGVLGTFADVNPIESLMGAINGRFETNPGEDLNINLSGNVAVGGILSYVVVQ